MFQIGDQFDRFQIQSHMAQGGMADIYRATDLMSGKEVVLKIPNRMMIGDPAQYERFQRELEVMRTLSHPAIQKGVSSGQFNRTPYLVTEMVKGHSMRELVEKETPMPQTRAVIIIRRIADGMAYCHEHDVIHRDLKPENILIDENDQPVILDFGLALTKGGHRVTYANLSSTAGTPDYMPPEQIEGQRGDARTDIYAVGLMLYELIAGKLPYSGDTPAAVMQQHLRGAIPRLDKTQPGVSPQIAAIVARSMQKNPEDRYATMREMEQALANPETVDLSILDKGTGEVTKVPFWRSPAFKTAFFTVLLIVAIIVFAIAAQALRGPK